MHGLTVEMLYRISLVLVEIAEGKAKQWYVSYEPGKPEKAKLHVEMECGSWIVAYEDE